MRDGIDHARILSDLVSHSLPNINRTFFLVVDRKYHVDRPLFVWAASKADAVECVDIVGQWTAGIQRTILKPDEGEMG